MQLTFKINYHTSWGQSLWIGCPGKDKDEMLPMNYVSNGNWVTDVQIEKGDLKQFSYKYFLRQAKDIVKEEWGNYRTLKTRKKGIRKLFITDSWRSATDPGNVFYTSAFTDNLFRRKSKNKKKSDQKSDKRGNYRFGLSSPMIDPDHSYCVVGNNMALGNWDAEKAVLLDELDFPLWQVEINLGKMPGMIEYKYGIYSNREKKLIEWETGENRRIFYEGNTQKEEYHLIDDVRFRRQDGLWRGSGVSIPVFSLRTSKSGGVGEFLDLKKLIEWAVQTGMSLVQVLPINDTVARHTWTDSYPYSAISVFAMHPIYLNMPAMGRLKDRMEMKKFIKEGEKLNALDLLDYEAVMRLKSRFYKRLYDEQKNLIFNSPGYKKFFKSNKKWLVSYAVFSCLRDRYKTVDFKLWKEFSVYDKQKVQEFASPSGDHFDDVAVHYYIQYHLHLQMKEVRQFARKKGVILKGDLPIGIYRYSVDAWKNPELYFMDQQAGAPPDAFSESGQNWGFPTYNWEKMHDDCYKWWRQRLLKMAEYFDAYRIDHILGFFRIWEIPFEQTDGLLGKFSPAIPLHKKELEQFGLQLDPDEYCKPSIKDYMLEELFGKYLKDVVKQCLISTGEGTYKLKAACNTQRKVSKKFAVNKKDTKPEQERKDIISKGLFKLISNILFIANDGGYHPRISLQYTYTFQELNEQEKWALNNLYNHYFYGMQEEFWKAEAMKKLPVITSATNMMVCGEDLGMVPANVPEVMENLGILSLEIQRMPKDNSMEFSSPQNANYLSVLSTSTHDMSTIRGWWKEDPEVTQRFYNGQLGMEGKAPEICTQDIAVKIVKLLLDAPAMWAIYPLQDLFAMSDDLRNTDVDAERINIPGISNHYWRYRMHLSIEELRSNTGFTDLLKNMIIESGRGALCASHNGASRPLKR